MQWYVLERYVDTVGHVTHRAKYVGDSNDDPATTPENQRGRRIRGRGSFRRAAGRKFSNRVLRGEMASSNSKDGYVLAWCSLFQVLRYCLEDFFRSVFTLIVFIVAQVRD